MPRGRPKGIPKTGGRTAGVPNKPKPIILSPEELEKGRQLALISTEVRSPKSVMLDAMLYFDQMARDYHAQYEYEKAAKFMASAVQVAREVAPYVHARLLAVETRNDESKPAFVIRAPAVMGDSASWQAMVGVAADLEAQSGAVVSQTEMGATSEPQEPKPAPATTPVVLEADHKTGRITVMPPGPRVVQPDGSAEWLAGIKKVG